MAAPKIPVYCVQVREVNPPGRFSALTGCNRGQPISAAQPLRITDAIERSPTQDHAGGGIVVMIAAGTLRHDDGTASWTHEGLMDSDYWWNTASLR